MENLKDRVTIYEVAKAANVSLATVSRVINNQGNVTEKTRIRVQETIKKLGYKPSGLAQALATSKSTSIGVVIPSANYVYISTVLNGIAEVCKEKGYNLQLFSTSHSREDALRMVEKVITSHVDGAIIFDDELDEEDVSKINSYYVPTIVINNNVEGERVGCVVFGYEHHLRRVLTTKLENDKKITPVFVHVHNAGRLLARTEKSFIEVCKEAGRPFDVVNIGDDSHKAYYDFLEYFKTHKEGYFIAYRDSIAASICNAAIESGLRIPEDVEVLSLLGTRYSRLFRPRLTNMNVDMIEVGRRATYMLSDLARNELAVKKYKVESSYDKGDSTKE